ncbi:MAG: RNA methyltransferase [Acidobacteria bacterium]|nr:RNA methyltransferase [Acidobacteriota bacterium]
MTTPLHDPSDERIADYRAVSDPELARRHGIFIAEGRLVVRRLLTDRRFTTRSVMVTEPACTALADVLEARADVPVYVVPQTVMNGVAGFNIHRGCLAVGERPAPRPWTEVIAGARVVVVLERIANADNVGGVFRNAAAFGADAVLLDPASTDPLYRKAIRTSMGAALGVSFARAEPWPDVLAALADRGFTTLALTPAASAPPLAAVAEAAAAQPVALVLGHEGEGLTDAATAACAHRARIPITAATDSLNVATATAIALYEVSRRIV